MKRLDENKGYYGMIHEVLTINPKLDGIMDDAVE